MLPPSAVASSSRTFTYGPEGPPKCTKDGKLDYRELPRGPPSEVSAKTTTSRPGRSRSLGSTATVRNHRSESDLGDDKLNALASIAIESEAGDLHRGRRGINSARQRAILRDMKFAFPSNAFHNDTISRLQEIIIARGGTWAINDRPDPSWLFVIPTQPSDNPDNPLVVQWFCSGIDPRTITKTTMVTADSVFAADARGVWSVSPFTPASTSTLPPPQPISTHPQRVSKPFKTTKISNMRETRDTSSRRREQTRLLEQDATKFWDFVNAGQLFDWDKGSWREFYKTFPRQDVADIATLHAARSFDRKYKTLVRRSLDRVLPEKYRASESDNEVSMMGVEDIVGSEITTTDHPMDPSGSSRKLDSAEVPVIKHDDSVRSRSRTPLSLSDAGHTIQITHSRSRSATPTPISVNSSGEIDLPGSRTPPVVPAVGGSTIEVTRSPPHTIAGLPTLEESTTGTNRSPPRSPPDVSAVEESTTEMNRSPPRSPPDVSAVEESTTEMNRSPPRTPPVVSVSEGPTSEMNRLPPRTPAAVPAYEGSNSEMTGSLPHTPVFDVTSTHSEFTAPGLSPLDDLSDEMSITPSAFQNLPRATPPVGLKRKLSRLEMTNESAQTFSHPAHSEIPPIASEWTPASATSLCTRANIEDFPSGAGGSFGGLHPAALDEMLYILARGNRFSEKRKFEAHTMFAFPFSFVKDYLDSEESDSIAATLSAYNFNSGHIATHDIFLVPHIGKAGVPVGVAWIDPEKKFRVIVYPSVLSESGVKTFTNTLDWMLGDLADALGWSVDQSEWKQTRIPIKQSLGTWSSGLLLALRSLTRTRDPNAARLEYESCALAETTLAAGLKRFILSHGQELV